MSWNIAPECLSAVILTIVLGYARRGSSLPTFKNICFHACLGVTLVAILSNILSTVLIYYYRVVPLWLNWAVAVVYFVCTPLMGFFYFCYSTAVLYEGSPSLKPVLLISVAPAALYLLVVLFNPATHLLFDLDRETGYTRGPWISLTYLIFYAYCLSCLVLAMWRRHRVDRQVFPILASFPLVAAVVVVVQQIVPDVILSGSAATCALLIIYLHLQNKRISIDYLTNLPNRQELLDMIGLLLQRVSTPPFVVVVVSLREFRQVNDAHGRLFGDALLREVSTFLIGAAHPHKVYRFGGDEFALLLRDGREHDVRRVVKAVLTRMERPWMLSRAEYQLDAAVGIAHYPESADTVEGMLNGVEYAVHKAKQKKGSIWCYCDQRMLAELRRRGQVAQVLKEQCARGEFELYYQPIYAVNEQTYPFAESLMRIPQSPIGPLFPNEFIPVAEETGLIIELTYEVLRKACRFVNRLTAQGVDIDGIHVNFSAVQFNQPNLAETVANIIERSGTPFSKIKIEFTESALAENPATVAEFARAMHSLGVRLGLDDFGTGYSNLDSVLNIPFGTIKLDKSLVWSAVDQERSAIMVRNIIRIFHEMGMRVLAEGVEDERQNSFVVGCGVELIQGYLYARPLPEDQAAAFFAAHPRYRPASGCAGD